MSQRGRAETFHDLADLHFRAHEFVSVTLFWNIKGRGCPLSTEA